ncbi:hypothetical protein [Streptomyces massasporeus]|uniref:hypothetical protein n=1 Tax=Streptomyces massasporeus TaxID=67324 RepID=UPI0033262311
MDAGVAAIMGSSVGALGAWAAAFITGVWGSKNMRRQLAAQEAAARVQLRVDHVRERREPRSVAYSEFIAQAHVVIDLVHDQTPRTIGDHAREVFEQLRKLNLMEARVSVEGPDSIVEPAGLVISSARQCGFYITTVPGGGDMSEMVQNDLLNALMEFQESLDAFKESARAALNSDGFHQGEISAS